MRVGLATVCLALVVIGSGCSSEDSKGQPDVAQDVSPDQKLDDASTPDEQEPPDLGAGDVGQELLDLGTDGPADATDLAEVGDLFEEVADVADVEPEVVVLPPDEVGIRVRQEGWMAGDLHMHTQHSDGDDPVAIVVALAEYLDDPTFIAFNPEYKDNPLGFISITDHRTVAQIHDPDFKSDKVVLIPGEEFGGPGHANIFGLSEHIPHDPDGDGPSHADYQNGATQAHNQGALFSINHPFIPDILFPWDVRNNDAMEICNAAWALMGPSLTPEKLAEWEAAKKTYASPMMKKATQYQGMGGNQQSLKLYEAQLTLGIHAALLGGSDRHVLFPVGFPTTWIKSTSPDLEGVMQGMKSRHTFVGRTPVSTTLEVSIEYNGIEYEMGDKIPLPEGEQSVEVKVRVGRSDGGYLKLIQGHRVATEEELEAAELGVVVFETPVEGVDFTAETTLTVKVGDWFYPLVYETVIPKGLPQELADKVPALATAASGFTEEDVEPLITALWDYIDPKVTLTPKKCDPSKWEKLKLQCMPPDTNGIATFFFPDWISRALNVVMVDGQPTEWTLGAVGSAVMFEPQE